MNIFKWLRPNEKKGGEQLSLSSDEVGLLMEGGSLTKGGRVVTERNMLGSTAVWAAIRVIAETIGTLPLHLYRRTGDGRERATDHTLYRLLHTQPNPHMTSLEWREAMAVSLCVWGQGYNRVDRLTPGGPVTGIMPVVKSTVEPKIVNGNVVYRWTDGGITRELSRDEILPIKGFGSVNSLEGFPPFRYHSNAIALAQVAEEFAAQFFADGARPSGLLIGENMPTSDQSNQLTKLVDKARGKMLILGGGFQYTAISSTNEEAQLLQTRRMQIAEAARIWRVPLHMLMEMSDAKYNNVEHENKNFLDYTLLPYLKRMEQALNTVLLTVEEQKTLFIEFDLKGLLRGDSKARGEFYRNMRMISAMTPNEVRAAENLPRVEGGDDLHVPLNMAPIDQLRDILSGDEEGKGNE